MFMRTGTPTDFTKLREQAGLTPEEAAHLIEVTRRTVYRYEDGTSEPSKLALRTLRDVAQERFRGQDEEKINFRFIDLFAGIGGLRLGFQSIGGRCVFTSEWDRWSRETYAINFPDNHELGGDIREFSQNPEKSRLGR